MGWLDYENLFLIRSKVVERESSWTWISAEVVGNLSSAFFLFEPLPLLPFIDNSTFVRRSSGKKKEKRKKKRAACSCTGFCSPALRPRASHMINSPVSTSPGPSRSSPRHSSPELVWKRPAYGTDATGVKNKTKQNKTTTTTTTNKIKQNKTNPRSQYQWEMRQKRWRQGIYFTYLGEGPHLGNHTFQYKGKRQLENTADESYVRT